MVNDMLQKYLLDGNCLMLLPEYIFQDVETGEYSFLYYPGAEEGGLSQLMDFFISRVDNEDMEAVETVYKIADLVNRERFVTDEVLKWFQDDLAEGDRRSDPGIDGAGVKGLDGGQACFSTSWQEEEGCGSGEEGTGEIRPFPDRSDEEQIRNSRKRLTGRVIPICAFCALVAGALAYVRYSYELSYQMEIYLIIGWAATGIIALATIVWYFYTRLKSKGEREQDSGEEERGFVPTCESEACASAPAPDMGNTVYIPWTENCENKLYCLDKKKRCQIDLGKLPLTVGKLAGAVDMVIDERSISRMHAKFSRNGNKFYVTDLNSTNGTFCNGLRLAPNASEVIEPGDEIRLGKLKFIYR